MRRRHSSVHGGPLGKGELDSNGNRRYYCYLGKRWRSTMCTHFECRSNRFKHPEGRKPKVSVKETKKPTAPMMTLAEMREKIGDFKKTVRVEIPRSTLEGSIPDVISGIKKKAHATGLKSPKLLFSSVYRNHRTVATWFITGERDFTDAELEAEGMKIINGIEREKKRQEEARRKDVEQFNRLAAKLGVPKMED